MILTLCMSIFLVLVCLDMGIKQYIEDTFEKDEERKTVIDGLVLRKVYNKGFAFNLMDDHPETIRSSSVCAGIGLLLYNSLLFFTKGKRVRKLGMLFVTAGAFSNIYDRLIREKVIDYIGIECKNSYLSKLTANLADIYIVIGTILVTISRMTHGKRNK